MSHFNTPLMEPAKIEPHDMRRDVETYRDRYPTLWEWSTPAGEGDADQLQRVALRAVVAGNPYAVALATLVLNIHAPKEDEAP